MPEIANIGFFQSFMNTRFVSSLLVLHCMQRNVWLFDLWHHQCSESFIIFLQAQSDDDDANDDVAVNVDGMGGFMEEFFAQVSFILSRHVLLGADDPNTSRGVLELGTSCT